jgi:hypothetical protein
MFVKMETVNTIIGRQKKKNITSNQRYVNKITIKYFFTIYIIKNFYFRKHSILATVQWAKIFLYTICGRVFLAQTFGKIYLVPLKYINSNLVIPFYGNNHKESVQMICVQMFLTT